MNNKSNLAYIQPKDGDGDDGNDVQVAQILIDTVDNGYILNADGMEEPFIRVFLFDKKGAQEMIQTVIDILGLKDKVRLEK